MSARSQTSSAASASFLRHVHCVLCRRPRDVPASAAPAAPPVPFWLTSCAHILCQTCAFPSEAGPSSERDVHTCAACRTSGVKMIPLTDALPASVAPFFRSLPSSLEELIEVHTFQVSHMGQLIDFLRAQVEKQKTVLNRVREDLLASRELKRTNEALNREIEQLRSQLGRRDGTASETALAAHRRDDWEGPAQVSEAGDESFSFQHRTRRRSVTPPSLDPPQGLTAYAAPSYVAPTHAATPARPERMTMQPARPPRLLDRRAPAAALSDGARRLHTASVDSPMRFAYAPAPDTRPRGSSASSAQHGESRFQADRRDSASYVPQAMEMPRPSRGDTANRPSFGHAARSRTPPRTPALGSKAHIVPTPSSNRRPFLP